MELTINDVLETFEKKLSAIVREAVLNEIVFNKKIEELNGIIAGHEQKITSLQCPPQEAPTED